MLSLIKYTHTQKPTCNTASKLIMLVKMCFSTTPVWGSWTSMPICFALLLLGLHFHTFILCVQLKKPETLNLTVRTINIKMYLQAIWGPRKKGEKKKERYNVPWIGCNTSTTTRSQFKFHLHKLLSRSTQKHSISYNKPVHIVSKTRHWTNHT